MVVKRNMFRLLLMVLVPHISITNVVGDERHNNGLYVHRVMFMYSSMKR